MPRTLPRSFFERDADVVARDLLGRTLVHETPDGVTAARIVETEAYFGPPGANRHLLRRRTMPRELCRRLVDEGDPAAHSFIGPTRRNRAMFGEAGHAYVYLIYGMHECMNVVTGPRGDAQAVLLRAGEPTRGVPVMRARRGGASVRARDIASGPAKLAQAMGVTRAAYGDDLTRGALHFEATRPWRDVEVTPRINVVGGEDLPLRFVARGSEHVSRAAATPRRSLQDAK